MMKLRIQPWLTSDCVRFIQNFFKWYPAFSNKSLQVLEFGAGNSTLFFLEKGCAVTSFESKPTYIDALHHMAKGLDETKYALNLTKAEKFSDIPEEIFTQDWDIIMIDGIARREILEKAILMKSDALIILDNIEHAAGWGKIFPLQKQRAMAYRKFLQSPDYQHYLFEQQEGRDGHATPDSTGFESPHRWISSVAWRQESLFGKLLLTQLGLPLVTSAHNIDINSLLRSYD